MSRYVYNRVEITLNKEWRNKEREYIYYPLGHTEWLDSDNASLLPSYVELIGCILSCCSEEGLQYLLDNTEFLLTESGADRHLLEEEYYLINVMEFTDPNSKEDVNLPFSYECLSDFYQSLNSEGINEIFEISSDKSIYIRLTSAEDFHDHFRSLAKLLGIEIRFISARTEKGHLIKDEHFFYPEESLVLQYEKFLKLDKMRRHSSNDGIPIHLFVKMDSVYRMLNHSEYSGPRILTDKRITCIEDAYRYSMRVLLALCTEEGLNELIGCCDFLKREDDGNSFCIKPTDNEVFRKVIIEPEEDFYGTVDYVKHASDEYLRIDSSAPVYVSEFDGGYAERLNKLAELLNLTIKWIAFDNDDIHAGHHFIKVFYPAEPKPVFDERMMDGSLFISSVRYD